MRLITRLARLALHLGGNRIRIARDNKGKKDGRALGKVSSAVTEGAFKVAREVDPPSKPA